MKGQTWLRLAGLVAAADHEITAERQQLAREFHDLVGGTLSARPAGRQWRVAATLPLGDR